MNEIIAGTLAPIILYGTPQGVWTPNPNDIGIPTQLYTSETFNLPPTIVPEVVIFE
jgi:hypothetical protein